MDYFLPFPLLLDVQRFYLCSFCNLFLPLLNLSVWLFLFSPIDFCLSHRTVADIHFFLPSVSEIGLSCSFSVFSATKFTAVRTVSCSSSNIYACQGNSHYPNILIFPSILCHRLSMCTCPFNVPVLSAAFIPLYLFRNVEAHTIYRPNPFPQAVWPQFGLCRCRSVESMEEAPAAQAPDLPACLFQ